MKKLILLLVMLSACSVFAADYTETQYKKAKELIGKRDYPAAESILVKLVTANPAYMEFRFTLGKVYFVQHKLDEAETLYKGITVINPNSNDAYYALSKVYAEKGSMADAALALENAVKINPENKEYYAGLSEIYSKLKDSKRAEFYAKKADALKAVIKPGTTMLARIMMWSLMAGVFVFFVIKNVNIAALFAVISSAVMFLGRRNIEALIFLFLGSVAMAIMWAKSSPENAKRTKAGNKNSSNAPPTMKQYDEALKKAYVILGLKEDATKSEIKSAFHKMAKKYHPDKTGGDKKGEEIFKAVNAAYELIRRKKKV